MRSQRNERWMDRIQSSGLPGLLFCSNQHVQAGFVNGLASRINVPIGCSYSWLKPVGGFWKVSRPCLVVRGKGMVIHWYNLFSKPEPRRWGPQRFLCIACIITRDFKEESPLIIHACMIIMLTRLMCEVLVACVQPLVCPSLWFYCSCFSAQTVRLCFWPGPTTHPRASTWWNTSVGRLKSVQLSGRLDMQLEAMITCTTRREWIFFPLEGLGFSLSLTAGVQSTPTDFNNSISLEMHV